jgi:uncharacterized protein (TIGR02271 family)
MTQGYSINDVMTIQGAPVYSSDDEKIGAVEEVYADEATRQPEWLGIGTGVFRTKRVLVPMQGANITPDAVKVPYPKDRVKDAPDIDDDVISQDTEQQLANYYGVDYSKSRSETGLPEGTPGAQKGSGKQTLTRSEEELAVGKRTTEAGRVRLRKYVTTEPVEEQINLTTERARVQREPVDRATASQEARIGEQQVEVPLSKEEAVVQKKTVPKEQVTVSKEPTTEQQTVSDKLRKEQIEVEGENVEEENA